MLSRVYIPVKYALQNVLGVFKASRLQNLMAIAIVQTLISLFILDIPISQIKDISFLLFVLSTLFVSAAGYIINDYHDQKVDMLNRPNQVVIGFELYRRPALLFHGTLTVLAIGVGFYLNPFLGVIHIFSSFTLWFYSVVLKRLPLIGNIAIAGLAGLLVLIQAVYFTSINKLILVYALFAAVIAIIREIIKDIEAARGESNFNYSTVPIIWGVRTAKYFIYGFSLLGITLLVVYLIIGAGTVVQLYFSCVSPVFVWFIYKIHRADTQKEYKLLHIISNWIIFSGIVSILFL